MNTQIALNSDSGRSPANSRNEWFLAFIFATLVGATLLLSFLTPHSPWLLVIAVAIPVGGWIVFAKPVWAIGLYLLICGSPFFGIHDYIEPGKYVAGTILLLLVFREVAIGGVADSLGDLVRPFIAIALIFCISFFMALVFRNSIYMWAREQAQYFPILIGPILARNLRSRRQVWAFVLFCAVIALLALPFEAFQFLLMRANSFNILTGTEFVGFERLPLPHFSVLNAGTLSALLGSWLLIRKSGFYRIANYVLAAVVPAIMLVSQSRVWTAISVASLLLPFALFARREPIQKRVAIMLAALVMLATSLFIAVKILNKVNPELADSLEARVSSTQLGTGDESIMIRVEGAAFLAKIAAQSPIFGHGLGYEVPLAVWQWAQSSSSVSGFDNAHLALLIKFGIIGTITFYYFFWALSTNAYSVLGRGSDRVDIVVSATFLVGLISILVVGFSYSALNVFENTNFIGVWSGLIIYLKVHPISASTT